MARPTALPKVRASNAMLQIPNHLLASWLPRASTCTHDLHCQRKKGPSMQSMPRWGPSLGLFRIQHACIRGQKVTVSSNIQR